MNIKNKEENRSGGSAEAQTVFRELQHTLPFRLLVRGFLTATKYLPVWLLQSLGRLVVVFFIALNFRNFRCIRRNLKKIKPGQISPVYTCMAYQVFKNYAFYLIDIFYLSHDARRLSEYSFEFHGTSSMEKALSSGRGIVLLTAHLGNWELGGLKLSGMGQKIHVVYSPDSSPLIEARRSFVRYAEGVQEVPLREGGFSSLKLLRILQEGGIVALQGDRLTFDSGQSVAFFGHDALLPRGPFRLAMASGSLVLPVFIPMTGYKSYAAFIEEPVSMQQSESSSEELKTNFSKITKIMEQYIAAYPTQWFTFMPFWKDDSEEFKK